MRSDHNGLGALVAGGQGRSSRQTAEAAVAVLYAIAVGMLLVALAVAVS